MKRNIFFLYILLQFIFGKKYVASTVSILNNFKKCKNLKSLEKHNNSFYIEKVQKKNFYRQPYTYSNKKRDINIYSKGKKLNVFLHVLKKKFVISNNNFVIFCAKATVIKDYIVKNRFLVCANNKVIDESYGGHFPIRKHRKETIFKNKYLLNKKTKLHIKGKNVLIAHLFSENYFHFLFETLGKFWILNRSNFFNKHNFIIPKYSKKSAQIKILKKCFKKLNFIEATNDFTIDNLFIPSFYNAPFSRENVNFSKKIIFKNFKVKKYKKKLRIFVSRQDQKVRKIKNFEKIKTLLDKYNFITVNTEKIGLNKEIEYFNNAEIVISTLGGSNANMLFCKKNTHFVELVPSDYNHVCYWMIADFLKLKYHRILCETVDENGAIYVNEKELTNSLSSLF